jgi:hypothetical protein
LGLRLIAGGMVNPNVALFGWVSYFESSGVELQEGNSSISSDDASLSMTSLLFGSRLYTASDFYFEGTLGTLREGVNDKISGEGYHSDTGWIFEAGAGKDWRFLSGLTLGLGLRLGYGQVPAADGGKSPSVAQFDLCFAIGYAGSRQ